MNRGPSWEANRHFPHFMEPECSLSHSQQPAMWLHPIHANPSHLLKVLFNSLASTARSCKWYLSLRSSHQNPVWTFTVPNTFYVPIPSHFSWFYHTSIIWWGYNIRLSCYLVRLSSELSYTLSLCSFSSVRAVQYIWWGSIIIHLLPVCALCSNYKCNILYSLSSV
jgi:hypothetical protein